MLSSTSDHENANWNHNELSHPCQNGYYHNRHFAKEDIQMVKKDFNFNLQLSSQMQFKHKQTTVRMCENRITDSKKCS
jgi:hypothetical protein